MVIKLLTCAVCVFSSAKAVKVINVTNACRVPQRNGCDATSYYRILYFSSSVDIILTIRQRISESWKLSTKWLVYTLYISVFGHEIFNVNFHVYCEKKIAKRKIACVKQYENKKYYSIKNFSLGVRNYYNFRIAHQFDVFFYVRFYCISKDSYNKVIIWYLLFIY